MSYLAELYRPSFGVLTDLYQLTMSYAYWKTGLADREGVFHLFFRKNPFGGAYAVCCGLDAVLEAVQRFRYDAGDIDYLATLKGNDDRPLFDAEFLDMLAAMNLTVDIDAIPEGTVVFAHEPLVRVRGSMMQCQLLETMLLNIVNFQTLVATKASRVCRAARGDAVLEFGLRRAQGIDGGVSASRAAFVGGCAATSNVMAGRLLGIPVKGTHAHSWVMAFDDELEAFRQYASAMPNNCVFLVDTYDSLRGVENAIRIGKELRENGHEMVGVRLDSGDLADLSIRARRLLDDAGFPHATIVASNDLDEGLIAALKEQQAQVTLWGVGTKLATAYSQPALGGVYKLSAIRDKNGEWQPRIKLSEQRIKISNPGMQQVRRFSDGSKFLADVIYDEQLGVGEPCTGIDYDDLTRTVTMPTSATCEDLLVPVVRGGNCVYKSPPLAEMRNRALSQLERLSARTKRTMNPQPYPVLLEQSLSDLKCQLIDEARETIGG